MFENHWSCIPRLEIHRSHRILTYNYLLSIADVQTWKQAYAADLYAAERVERGFSVSVVVGPILRNTVDGRHTTEGCYEVG